MNMAGLSPTQRTLKELRNQGRICAITERWNSYIRGGKGGRIDLFGFIDIIALDSAQGIIAIQSCGQSYAAHLRKLKDSECTENVIEWLKCGGYVELWGWRKVKLHRLGKAMRWKPRITEITMSEFNIKEEK